MIRIKDRLYFLFYKKLNNIYISNILSNISYMLINLYFIMTQRLLKKDIVKDITAIEARQFINELSTKPSTMNIVNRNLKFNSSINLSIIVPVYNVEKYLEECIESILNQKTQFSYEIILIDDGSTDLSSHICDKYQKLDNRIRVKHITNNGNSYARNLAIQMSYGEYLMFVDSDDIIEKNTIEIMMKEVYRRNLDIVQSGHYTFNENKNQKRNYIKNKINITKEYKDMMQYHGFLCAKIIKKDIFRYINIPEGYWFEDSIVRFTILKMCNNFGYIDKALYGYRRNEEGMTSKVKGSNKSVDSYWIIEELINMNEVLNLEMDKYSYLNLLYHLSHIMNYRTLHFSEDIRKNLFILSCDLVKQINKIGYYRLPYIYKKLEKSFDSQNYTLWELCSKTI